MRRQHVKLLTRPLGGSPESGGQAELVVAVMVNGQRIELPMDSRVIVSQDAGSSTPLVTFTVLADTVRYLPDPQLDQAAADSPPPRKKVLG